MAPVRGCCTDAVRVDGVAERCRVGKTTVEVLLRRMFADGFKIADGSMVGDARPDLQRYSEMLNGRCFGCIAFLDVSGFLLAQGIRTCSDGLILAFASGRTELPSPLLPKALTAASFEA